MNPEPTDQRQQSLTRWRCFYDDPRHRELRPDCQSVAVVAYGTIQLCSTCNKMRSAVGKGTAPRPVPGAELDRLADAAQAAADADRQLATAAHGARTAGATWTQIGDALGLSRQAAQQRWGRP
jgi:hypothetical protein